MPSGSFTANAAWLSVAAMAHNLLRAAGALASLPLAKARAATIRRDLIAVAARTARHGRRDITLHLPMAGTASTNGCASWPPAVHPPLRPDQPRASHRTAEWPTAATPPP